VTSTAPGPALDPAVLGDRVAAVTAAVARARHRPADDEPFPGADGLPTMLAREEVALLHGLARDVVEGWGDVVELGTFLGGSTVALGTGLRGGRADRPLPRIHTYDLFVQEAWPSFGVTAGENVLPRWEATVADVRDLVDVHVGPLSARDAPDGPVELLFVDVVKQASTMTETMHGFVTLTRPGSVIVHQDMFHWGSPWVLTTVSALWDRLVYVGEVARASGVFVVAAPLDNLADAVDWGALSTSSQLALIDELAERFQHPTLHGTLQLAALYLAKTTDPGLYQRRLARARTSVDGPRLRRVLAEVEAADGARGALLPGRPS
jgi:predicted O-methyltransferase YrrM